MKIIDTNKQASMNSMKIGAAFFRGTETPLFFHPSLGEDSLGQQLDAVLGDCVQWKRSTRMRFAAEVLRVKDATAKRREADASLAEKKRLEGDWIGPRLWVMPRFAEDATAKRREADASLAEKKRLQ